MEINYDYHSDQSLLINTRATQAINPTTVDLGDINRLPLMRKFNVNAALYAHSEV